MRWARWLSRCSMDRTLGDSVGVPRNRHEAAHLRAIWAHVGDGCPLRLTLKFTVINLLSGNSYSGLVVQLPRVHAPAPAPHRSTVSNSSSAGRAALEALASQPLNQAMEDGFRPTCRPSLARNRHVGFIIRRAAGLRLTVVATPSSFRDVVADEWRRPRHGFRPPARVGR